MEAEVRAVVGRAAVTVEVAPAAEMAAVARAVEVAVAMDSAAKEAVARGAVREAACTGGRNPRNSGVLALWLSAVERVEGSVAVVLADAVARMLTSVLSVIKLVFCNHLDTGEAHCRHGARV